MEKVKIGKYEDVRLEAPPSVAIQLDVINLAATNFPRSLYAALGVCWRGRGRPTVSYARAGYQPAVYGALVLEELLKRPDGTNITEIVSAGGAALQVLREKTGEL
jgi:hypothetical protein